MKKNDLILLTGTLLFSFLFYKQGAGLNVFIFSLIVPALLAVYKPLSIKNKLWVFGAAITILTGFSVFANSTLLSVFAFYMAVSYLGGITVSLNASPLSAIAYASFSYATSAGFMISDSIHRKKTGDLKEKKKINWNALILLGIFIIAVVTIFFFLYQTANPLFKELTKFINLDFISFGWIMFTFLGFLLMYGFMYARKLKKWDLTETNSNFRIDKQKTLDAVNRFFWFQLDAQLERKAGIVLFSLLNLMILTINILDISFLWSGMNLPEGFTFAGYLHQGIYTLIFSCVLAILLILLMFRGKLNFIEKNSSLKVLAYLWIIQNILIALSCAYRNFIYISNYALTYKRIILYMLLILLIAGLVTAIIKIMQSKNNYYLFRMNSYAFLIVFIGVSLVNWDSIITKYNIKNSEYPDISYLVTLNNSGLPHLLQYAETSPSFEKAKSLSIRNRSFYTPESFYWQGSTLTDQIYDRTYLLLEKNNQTVWKSYNLSDAMTIRKIKNLYEHGHLKQFIINNTYDINIDLLSEFKGLQRLIIKDSKLIPDQGPESLSVFTKLRELQLSGMELEHIDDLPQFIDLEAINLMNNRIADFTRLDQYSSLKNVDISSNPVEDINFLKNLTGIEILNLSNTRTVDLHVLSLLTNLKRLNLTSMQGASFETLPVCEKLEEINLSDNSGLSKYKNLTAFLSGAPELRKVILQDIGLGSLAVFSDTVIIMNHMSIANQNSLNSDVLQNILYLDVSYNSLSNFSGLRIFRNIQILRVTNNSISDIKHVRYCTNLTELDVSYNPVNSVAGIEQLKKLKCVHFNQFTFSDISLLSKLPQLEALTLRGGYISDPEQFRNFSKLKYLDLASTNISTLSFLESLSELEFLNLTGYTGDDFDVLLKCPSLKVVILPPVALKVKRRLEQEIPQIRIIRDWEFADEEFYKTKYCISELTSY